MQNDPTTRPGSTPENAKSDVANPAPSIAGDANVATADTAPATDMADQIAALKTQVARLSEEVDLLRQHKD